jgi:NAD+ synthase (glutamine-hydrolysing)
VTRIRVASAVLNQTPLDWENNQANILAAIKDARQREARILCLPEMAITGYGCEDAFHSPGLQRTALDVLQEIVAETSDMILAVSVPLLHKSGLFNAACLAANGEILGFVAKRFLASEGLHYEPRWFKPWPLGVCDTAEVGGKEYPIGDLAFDCGGVTIGLEICEDAWVAKRPGGDMALAGVDVILNPSASHFAFGKFEIRKRLVVEGSRALGVSYVSANLLGNEAGRAIYSGGALIASAGRLLAAGPRFSFQPVCVTTAVIDIDATRMNRARTGSYQPDLTQNTDRVDCEFSFPELEPEMATPEMASWESSPSMKEEEFTRALTLGLFDYLRKSRSRGFVVSLSGGADSSAVACLGALMSDMAAAELGLDRFNQILGHIPALQEARNDRDRVGALLSCAYQASRNSSDDTRNSAVSLAEALGAEMACWEIDELVEDYTAKVESFLGRKLTWDRDDLALQNIQARVRGPSVWMLANVKGALLLATSNRSEAAVGYATMDGDTCGGLSPIAGIDKAFLRRWLRWLEKEGPDGVHPVPALAAVNGLTPTAELRPVESTQTDEADLMPYEVLDPIERAAIRDKQTPVEIFRLMRAQFPQFSIEQLHTWVERFFRLWCRNQWKRERYAPSFHLDDENLDPKTWCRFPILSGGFQRELEELTQYVQNLKH